MTSKRPNASSPKVAAVHVLDNGTVLKLYEPGEFLADNMDEARQEELSHAVSPPEGIPTGAIGIYGPSGLTVAEAVARLHGRDLNDPDVRAELDAKRPTCPGGWIGIYGPSGYTVEEAFANLRKPDGDSKL